MENAVTVLSRNEALVSETISRIINDFRHLGITLSIRPENTSYDALLSALRLEIEALISHDRPRLMFVINRIDIAEKTLRSAIRSAPGKPQAEILAALIIEREFQKVMTNKVYKAMQEKNKK